MVNDMANISFASILKQSSIKKTEEPKEEKEFELTEEIAKVDVEPQNDVPKVDIEPIHETMEEPVKEDTPTEETEPVVEEKTEDVKEETTPVIPEKKTEPVENKAEETPVAVAEPEEKEQEKPKRHRRKTSSKKVNMEEVEVNTPPITKYKEVVTSICHPCIDPEWEKCKEYVDKEISLIKLTSDVTPATITVLIERIDNLFDYVAQWYHEQKAILTNLTDRDCGLLARVKALYADGANEQERRRNGVYNAMHYKDPNGNEVNLYDVIAETESRMAFLSGVYDRLSCKQKMIITLSASLKMSNN